MKYILSQKYDTPALMAKIMGPNPIKLTEELLQESRIPKGAAVCDLGSGQGLTSVFLAKEYGFTNRLPNIACDGNYLVTAGKSCWAAINDFVYGMTGNGIFVTADNCIVPARQGKKSAISPHSIVSARRVINRGDQRY